MDRRARTGDTVLVVSWEGGVGVCRKTSARDRNCRKKSLMVKDHYQLFMVIIVYVQYNGWDPNTAQKPFTEDPLSEGSNILVWFGSLYVLPSP